MKINRITRVRRFIKGCPKFFTHPMNKAKHKFESMVKNCSLAIIFSLILELRKFRGYIKPVQQKAVGLALVGYQDYIGASSPLRTFFMRTISMHSHVMAKLERDILGCAGFLCHQSTNPFQLCHPHLVVNGKAPIKHIGAH